MGRASASDPWYRFRVPGWWRFVGLALVVVLAGSAAESQASSRGRGWLGVALRATPPQSAGVLVSEVLRGSPASRGGLLPGDVLLRVGNGPASSPSAVAAALAAAGGGAEVPLLVRRGARVADSPLASLRLLKVRLIQDPGIEGRLRLGYLGHPAPEFVQLEAVQGSPPLKLRELEGQVVLLEFWASWCVACRALAPQIKRWFDGFGARGLQVLALTVEPVGVAARAALEWGYEYPVAADPAGKTAQAYGAHALPTLFLIDRSGRVVDLLVGGDREGLTRFEASIRRSLSSSSGSESSTQVTPR